MLSVPSRNTDWLPSYNFQVQIGTDIISFSKISSIEMTIETEALMEGGESRYSHTLYKPPSVEKTLHMERGVASTTVLEKRLRVGAIFGVLHIFVCDAQRKPKKAYEVRQVVLKKRSFTDLDAMSDEVFVERLELAYNEITDVTDLLT